MKKQRAADDLRVQQEAIESAYDKVRLGEWTGHAVTHAHESTYTSVFQKWRSSSKDVPALKKSHLL
jgi:hypothetical protein